MTIDEHKAQVRIAEWDALLERTRKRQGEVIRLAKARVFTNESELVDADDPRLAEWAKVIERIWDEGTTSK